MALTNYVYINGLKEMFDGTVAFLTHDIRAMLVGTGYTPDVDHLFANTPAAFEINVTGYTPGFSGTGRKALAGKTIVADTGNNRVAFDCNDITWTSPGAGATVRWIIVYRHNSSDSNSRLLFALQINDTATDGTNFVWNVHGVGVAAAA